MLELGRKTAIGRQIVLDGRIRDVELFNRRRRLVEHRLDRYAAPGLKFGPRTLLSVRRRNWVVMTDFADPMSADFAHDMTTLPGRKLVESKSDIARSGESTNLFDPLPHCFLCGVGYFTS